MLWGLLLIVVCYETDLALLTTFGVYTGSINNELFAVTLPSYWIVDYLLTCIYDHKHILIHTCNDYQSWRKPFSFLFLFPFCCYCWLFDHYCIQSYYFDRMIQICSKNNWKSQRRTDHYVSRCRLYLWSIKCIINS